MANPQLRKKRRRAYFDAKVHDPLQLLRISGQRCPIQFNNDRYFEQENPKHLHQWHGDARTTIDRFDARDLLDQLPTPAPALHRQFAPYQMVSMPTQFERYRDLVELNCRQSPYFLATA
ncbi:hypothetical protein H4R34_000658 [Dimargaris verticillata]|uniref:Suppressor of white apricot N-terminal domain-containing protein n=1 Tax=Dimargaris verticillata TaxID=2761393 RepID=A0A9W8BC93_9FUNG|nr:hypothetical protein H4R34_000658 [Dimargaris verticillata]